MNKTIFRLLIILLLAILGFTYRLQLASLIFHYAAFDEATYIDFAYALTRQFWVADCCARTFGYPLTEAILIKLFSSLDVHTLIYLQAVMDVSTALILYFISKKVFKQERFALVTYVFYIFNPLTSSYVGLYLSEVQTMFLMVTSLWFLLNRKHQATGFLLGLSLSLLSFTRILFWWWSVVIILCLGIWQLVRKKKLWLSYSLTIVGFAIPATYALIANVTIQHVWSVSPKIPPYLHFTNSLSIPRYPELLEDFSKEVPPGVLEEAQNVLSADPVIFKKNVAPVIEKAINRIKADPFWFIRTRLMNMVYLWDQRNLYYYRDPFMPTSRSLVRLGNIVFLVLSALGVFSLIRKKDKSQEQQILLLYVLWLVFFLTLPSSLFTAEERFTLPAYPVLFLFVPFGISTLKKTISRYSK